MRDLVKNLFRIPDPGVKKTPDPGSATLIITIEKINTILIFKCHLGKKIRRHTSIIQKKDGGVCSRDSFCVCTSGFFVL
jgi:hypothetical protein